MNTAHEIASDPKPRKKVPVWWLITALALIAGIAGGTYACLHHSSPTPSVTLYYDDGKTILWRDSNPAIESTAQPAKAPYFVDLVRTELQQKFGAHYYRQGAWAVTTTLDPHLQASAEQLVAANVPNISSQTGGRADEEATVLEDATTGQIKALVGGIDRSNPDHGLINFATTPVAPGSSIKPFTYAALISNTNAGAGSTLADVQAPLPGYPCTNRTQPSASSESNCLWNYDLKYAGNMSLRYALGTNRNVPVVQAGSTVGEQKVISLIDAMGADHGYNCYVGADFSQKTACYSAALLGDGAYLTLADVTHALASLANNGKKLPQTTIVSARVNGKQTVNWHQPAGQQVLSPETAFIINNILSDPNASYLPGSCTTQDCTTQSAGGYKFQRSSGWKFAVDPGMSFGGYDAVMASWSSKYVAVSWVGNHAENTAVTDNAVADEGLSAATLTETLTRGLMTAAHASLSPTNWQQPAGIQMLQATEYSAKISSGDVEPSPTTDLYPSWYKP